MTADGENGEGKRGEARSIKGDLGKWLLMVLLRAATGSDGQVVTAMEHVLDAAQVYLAADTIYFPNTDYPGRAKGLRQESVDYWLTGLLLHRLSVIRASNCCCMTLLCP
jgi:hypothetical protein